MSSPPFHLNPYNWLKVSARDVANVRYNSELATMDSYYFNVLEQDTRSVYDNVNDDNAAELQFKD